MLDVVQLVECLRVEDSVIFEPFLHGVLNLCKSFEPSPLSRREVDDAPVNEVWLIAELLDYGRLVELVLVLLEFQYEPRFQGNILEL